MKAKIRSWLNCKSHAKRVAQFEAQDLFHSSRHCRLILPQSHPRVQTKEENNTAIWINQMHILTFLNQKAYCDPLNLY
jgi:hypothetical protein